MFKPRITSITGATEGTRRGIAERLASGGRLLVGLGRSLPRGRFPGECRLVGFTDRAGPDNFLLTPGHRTANDNDCNVCECGP